MLLENCFPDKYNYLFWSGRSDYSQEWLEECLGYLFANEINQL